MNEAAFYIRNLGSTQALYIIAQVAQTEKGVKPDVKDCSVWQVSDSHLFLSLIGSWVLNFFRCFSDDEQETSFSWG